MTRIITILLIFYVCVINCNTDDKLQLVQILFRHGERSPTKSYTNDPHKNHQWPGGFDQLTNRGKKQLYDLGLNIKNRYKDILKLKYSTKSVYVHSSYADRCHMSAQLLLAGLYPPKNMEIWNANLFWQPIPVHETPRNLDNKIALKKKCPKYDREFGNVHKSEKVKKINEKNSELYKYLSFHTGDNITSVLQVEILYNTLEIEQINNLTLPEWTASVFNKHMKSLATTSLALFTETNYMKRIHGGMLVKEIINTMLNKTNGSDMEMKLYSGHDLTIVSILNCLGLDVIKPEFGSSIIFELHKTDKHIVKVFYQDNPYAEVKYIKLPFCPEPCELNKFKDGLTSIIPINWDQECLL